jgi:prepilin-type processing-associated H-X9-DG protein
MGPDRWTFFECLLMLGNVIVPALLLRPCVRGAATAIRGWPSRPARFFVYLGLGLGTLIAYWFGAFFIALMIVKPVISARKVVEKSECHGHLRQLAQALNLYAQEWDETYPPAQWWSLYASNYLPPEEVNSTFRCRAARTPYAYGFNSYLDHLPSMEIDRPVLTVLLAETDSYRPGALVSGPDALANDRHFGSNVAFVDGHVRWFSHHGDPALIWELIWDARPKQEPHTTAPGSPELRKKRPGSAGGPPRAGGGRRQGPSSPREPASAPGSD